MPYFRSIAILIVVEVVEEGGGGKGVWCLCLMEIVEEVEGVYIDWIERGW